MNDFVEEFGEGRLTGHREPLHAVLVGACPQAQEVGDMTVEFGDGIGIENFFFERQGVAFAVPARAAAQIAFAIEHDDSRLFKRRGVESSRGVGFVMIDGIDLRFGEDAERGCQCGAGGQRTRQRDVIDIGVRELRD